MTSRISLLGWLKGLGISIEKIEEIGKGTALCELMKRIEKDFPAYKKEPRNENDYIYNLKLVKESMDRRGFKMPFPIERLVKLKMQDNLEVIQNIYKNIAKKESWLCDKEIDKDLCKDVDKQLGKKIDEELVKEVDEDLGKNIDEELGKEVDKELGKEVDNDLGKEVDEELDKIAEGSKRMSYRRNNLEETKEWIEILHREREFYFKKLLEIERILKESIDEREKLKEKIFKVLYKR